MEDTDKSSKLYYTIGEVAEMFQESVPTIRFWENHFKILKPKKNKKGNRLFTPEDIKNLKVIVYLLRERGLTIKGANLEIMKNQDSIERNADLANRLRRIKSLLNEAYHALDDSPAVPAQES